MGACQEGRAVPQARRAIGRLSDFRADKTVAGRAALVAEGPGGFLNYLALLGGRLLFPESGATLSPNTSER